MTDMPILVELKPAQCRVHNIYTIIFTVELKSQIQSTIMQRKLKRESGQ